VRDTDTDRETGATLWGINWDDGKTSDFTLADMQDFCVKRRDGNRASPPMVTAIEPEPDPDLEPQTSMADVLARLTRLGVEHFRSSSDNMSWTAVCTEAGVPRNQRKLYYQYLSEQHGYGHVAPPFDSDWYKDRLLLAGRCMPAVTARTYQMQNS
jgi:hypothetical protein